MKHQRHLGSSSGAALQEAVQIRTLTLDLNRIVRIIDCDIAAEEEHARLFDRICAYFRSFPGAWFSGPEHHLTGWKLQTLVSVT